jgi:hypothetical protein
MLTFDAGKTRRTASGPAGRAGFHGKAEAESAGRVRVRQVLQRKAATIRRQPSGKGGPAVVETPETLAKALREAFRGWGTDEDEVYRALSYPPTTVRAMITYYNDHFNDHTGKGIVEDIRDEFSGAELERALRLLTDAEVNTQLVAGEPGGGPAFKPVVGKEAEEEFTKSVAAYKKLGKSEREAAFLAMDDMFAERVKATGGKRLPGTATPSTPGAKTFLKVSAGIVYGGETIPENFYDAAIDDSSYNCHSYTFYDAKRTKVDKLKKLAKTIPKEGEDLAGQKYYEATDLVQEGVHFELGPPTVLFPRWVLDGEVRTLLEGYKPLPAGGKVAVGDVVIYSTDGDYPHSGRVTEIDGKGNPVKVKGKWGHYSLFEHPPDAVPAHYGKPSYYRKK